MSERKADPLGDRCTACPTCGTRLQLTHAAAVGILINRLATLGSRIVENEHKLANLPSRGASLAYIELHGKLTRDREKRTRLESVIAELRDIGSQGEPPTPPPGAKGA